MKSRTLKCGCVLHIYDNSKFGMSSNNECCSKELNIWVPCGTYSWDELKLLARTDMSEERVIKLRILR